jgi:Flp pilus assembly protein TadG
VRDERGQVTVMIVGLAFVLLLTIAVVVDASAAYLQRSGLATVADGAALAGTEALDLTAGYEHGFDDPVLSESLAREAITVYLHDTGAGERFPGLTYTVRVQDNEVRVDVHAPLDLPLRVPGSPTTATIGASGSAELAAP